MTAVRVADYVVRAIVLKKSAELAVGRIMDASCYCCCLGVVASE